MLRRLPWRKEHLLQERTRELRRGDEGRKEKGRGEGHGLLVMLDGGGSFGGLTGRRAALLLGNEQGGDYRDRGRGIPRGVGGVAAGWDISLEVRVCPYLD